MSNKVKIKSLSGTLPEYKTKGSSGMDLRAYLHEPIALGPGERELISTGIFIELPEGLEAQVRARSGIAVSNGVGLVNGIGTIDSDYRGEIKVCLINWGNEVFVINDGDRIAQLVVARYESVQWEAVDTLGESHRGEGGFGHTGI